MQTWKLRTEYKTRITDWVYKNSFRKVKRRETDSGLDKTVIRQVLALHTNIIPLAGHAVYSPLRRRGEGKHDWLAISKEGYAAAQGNWKWNSEFYEKEELEENSIYSFKTIEDITNRRNEIERHRPTKIVSDSIGVSESDNSISKPWGYEEMKNPDERVNIGAVEAKNAVFSGEGLLTYTMIKTEIKYIMQGYILSDDVLIYTYVNMYIAFMTPVMDVRDWDQV